MIVRRLFWFVLILALFMAAQVAPVTAQTGSTQEVCDHYLNQFYAEPDWRERLLDPVYTSPEQVVERYNLYWPVYDCLSNGDIPVTGEQAEARQLAGFFVTLAGGAVNPDPASAGQGGAVRFQDLQDPAIVALRDEVGLPQPEGMVYIWLYPSREALPESLRPFFNSPNIRGLTLLTRYIVIIDNVAELTESQRGTRLEDFQRDQRSKVYSHEYVHAYIKSLLGPEKAFDLPKWFDEGLAIYFSGSSEPGSQVYLDEQGQQIWISTPPEEYARYRDTFKYLEQEHGREKFLELIRTAVLSADPSILYRNLGADNEEELFQLAVVNREQRGLERLGYMVFGLAGLALVTIFFIRLASRAPVYAPAGHQESISAYYLRSHGDLRGLERMLLTNNQSQDVEHVQSRLAAAEALSDLNDSRSADLLARSLRTDRSSSVRMAAARGLGHMANLQRRHSPMDPVSRNHAIVVLFPALREDPVEEVRMMAAEALYHTAGTAGLRPLKGILREEIKAGRVSPAFQRWLVEWTTRDRLEGLLIDLYPWLGEEARKIAVERLRWRLTPTVLERLGEAQNSGDRDLRELASAVLGR